MLYNPPSPPIPPAPKTGTYTFTRNDDNVPISFNAAAGAISAALPDPATVPGVTFIIVKTDTSINVINVNAAVGGINGAPMFSLTDQFSSLIVMAANGAYTIVAQSAV